MQEVVGSVLEGKVKQIKDYGAFIELPDGQKGLVHISEVASGYVVAVADYLKIGQVVKVKIISVGDNGKLGLSIKKAVDEGGPVVKREIKKNFSKNFSAFKAKEEKTFDSPLTFEDMVTKFKQESEKKMKDLKKNIEEKRGGG